MGLFKKSSCTGSTPQTSSYSIVNILEPKKKYISPDPNPHEFEILKKEKAGKGMIVEVKYEGCTTFDGVKLLLLRSQVDFKYFRKLDPHILGNGHIVCARFEPTPQGWDMARMSAEML